MDNTKNNSVLFWRADRWHAGWIMHLAAPEIGGGYRVGWIDGGKPYTKIVEQVIHINVAADILQDVPR